MIFWYEPHPAMLDSAKLSDVDDLAEIHAASFHRGWSPAEIEALLVQDRVITVVLRRSSPFGTRSPIGFVMVRATADEAEVLTLAVNPRHRGKGHARRLMDEAIRRLYHDRVKALFLEVDEGNVPALTLYGRLGFLQVGRRGQYYAAPGAKASAALVMRADLT
ncbi:GNAT family N-acetyltransferase [Chthonobacter albigriseus]|uniref:GNAT family N-acetyltransferase n=1 Tax=Chthonobacter albigriseus TaxID=1683161 RepID=UPI0015EED4B8|nr:GNAT family N-acetyltransferase [Chthonobacter albigriseus]